MLGLQRPRIGFSVGLRPAISFDASWWNVYALCDPTLAITLAPRISLTLALPFGLVHMPYAGTAGFGSGAVGLHRRF